jgi:lipopolysaccharide heptosyltransferase I
LNRFLIVRIGSLGDVVHAIPFAAALRSQFPHARIDWMVDPRYVELLELVPVIDGRVPVDTRAMFRGGERTRLLRTLRELRRVGYDVAFDLQGLLKSAVLARAVGARHVVGFAKEHLREPMARLFYSAAIDPGGAAHVIDKNLALLSAAGVSDRRVRFPLALPASPLVESIVARGRDGFVLINPGAAWPNKRWPPDRFGAVAAAIHRQHGLQSFVLWGPGEEGLAQAVASSSSGAADVLPATTVAEIAGVARAARLMISGDTGPMHIAAAVGTPLVTLFGPTRPERNGPWSAHDIAISRVDRCVCVYERTCRRGTPCINDISVEEVMGAVGRRLDSTREAPGAVR